MHAPRNLAAACALSALSLVTLAAAADTSAAAKLYDRGIAHMKGGRFEQACPLIEASYKLEPLPGALFALADCEANRGRIATAIARYDEYLAAVEELTPAKKIAHREREANARKNKAALELLVPRLVLVLPKGAPAGTVVKRDSVVVEASELGESIEIDPGEHTVTTQAPGGPVTEVRVDVKPGQRMELELAVKPAPVQAEKQPWGPALYAVSGVALVGFVFGATTGIAAIGERATMSSSDDGRIPSNCSGQVCNAEGIEAVKSLKTLGLMSTIGVGVGIAAGAAAAAIYFLDRAQPAAPPPTNAGLRVSAGLMAAGEGGAALGLRGVW